MENSGHGFVRLEAQRNAVVASMSDLIQRRVTLTAGQRRALRAEIKANGERKTAARLGIGRNTLVRAAAGLRLYPGTIALLDKGLQDVTQGEVGRPPGQAVPGTAGSGAPWAAGETRKRGAA
jgi:hypothetical protein